MRPLGVVLDAEVLDDDPGLRESPKLLAVETFITKPAMEGFDEPVLPGTGRLDVNGLDSLSGQPRLEFMGNELRAVVRADKLRRALLCDGRFHQCDHVAGLERTVRPQHVALKRG